MCVGKVEKVHADFSPPHHILVLLAGGLNSWYICNRSPALAQIHVFFILFGPVLLRLEDLGLACGITGIVIDTAFFRAGSHNETLLNELLVKIDIEVLKYLLVVNETKIAVLRQIILADAVNRIDGTSLELVDVACDHFCSLLGIWQK